MAKLPPVTIPDEALELIAAFASQHKITLAQAVRTLLQSSTELAEFASTTEADVKFDVRDWGGRRIPKDVQERLDTFERLHKSTGHIRVDTKSAPVISETEYATDDDYDD